MDKPKEEKKPASKEDDFVPVGLAVGIRTDGRISLRFTGFVKQGYSVVLSKDPEVFLNIAAAKNLIGDLNVVIGRAETYDKKEDEEKQPEKSAESSESTEAKA